MGGDEFDDDIFDRDFDEAPNSSKVVLRPYQLAAHEAVFKSWQDHRSVLLVLPTGCGKTITAAAILRDRAKEGRILWLAHRGELLDQAAEALGKKIGLSCEIEKAERRADRRTLFGTSDVVVGSVQTLRGTRLTSWKDDSFATIVVDEAHHAPARTYRQILEQFPDAKVLGLTATPDRGDGIAMGHVFTDCAFTYETRTAITEGWLTPIVQKQVRVAEIDLSQVKTVRGDLDETELAKIMELEGSLHGIASAIAQSREGRPTIVFCTSVEQSKELSRIMNDYGIRSTQVDGTTPPLIRAERLTQFQTREVDALVNVGVLTEGFDAPLTACVAMARPTKSRSLYAQMLGRGLRPVEPPEVDASAQLRRAAIAASRKPDCLVLDFVANSGKHKLINPIDILAGKPLPPEVEARVRELTEEGRPTEEALKQAEDEAIQREREREEKRKKNAAIRAKVAMKTRSVDPFGATTDALDPEHRATQAQLDYLANFVKPKDLEKLAPNLSKSAAWKLTDTLKKRRKEGLCTYGQARVLARAGLRIDVPVETASKIIDHLAANNWLPSAQILERFGEKKQDEGER